MLGEECMDYKNVRCKTRPKKSWSEVVERDCQARQLCKDYMDYRWWRKL